VTLDPQDERIVIRSFHGASHGSVACRAAISPANLVSGASIRHAAARRAGMADAAAQTIRFLLDHLATLAGELLQAWSVQYPDSSALVGRVTAAPAGQSE